MTARYWIKVFLKFLLVFSPIIFATYFISGYGNGANMLTLLNNIDGNIYTINNILLLYIVAGYFAILLGLIFYLVGIMDDIFSYSGNNRKILTSNKICLFALLLVLVVLVLYNFFFGISISGLIAKGDKIFNLHNLVLFNKYLSLGIFSIFLIVDLLIISSQQQQLAENSSYLLKNSNDSSLIKKIQDNERYTQMSKDATFYINIPILLLSLLAIIFTHNVFHIDRFKNVVDQTFKDHMLEIPNSLDDRLFDLFLNGLETGVITSGIIFSQLIFIFIKIRSDFKYLKS